MIGVKATLNDVHQMINLNVDCIEILPACAELKNNFETLVATFTKIIDTCRLNAVIHAPEYLTSYQLVDMCALDYMQRSQSIDVIKNTLEFADTTGITKVIVHPGGVVSAAIKKDKEKYMYNLEKSLCELKSKKLLVENMPWFYWMADGNLHECMVCRFATDFKRFFKFTGGINLDICHAYLSTKKGGYRTIEQFVKMYNQKILHVHVSDALPPTGEGLQIGDGNIDFKYIFGLLDKNADICYLPEIIDGHKKDGAGFKIGIERLRKLLFE